MRISLPINQSIADTHIGFRSFKFQTSMNRKIGHYLGLSLDAELIRAVSSITPRMQECKDRTQIHPSPPTPECELLFLESGIGRVGPEMLIGRAKVAKRDDPCRREGQNGPIISCSVLNRGRVPNRLSLSWCAQD